MHKKQKIWFNSVKQSMIVVLEQRTKQLAISPKTGNNRIHEALLAIHIILLTKLFCVLPVD